MLPFARRLLLPLLVLPLLIACGDDRASPTPEATTTPAKVPAAAAKPAAGKPPAAPKRPGEEAIPAGAVSRWYVNLLNGQKAGSLHVVWAPSTWQGKTTVRDTTTESSSTQRDMAGTVDLFESASVTQTERGEDGTLWWTSSVVTEAKSRKKSFETTWTGSGYDYVARLNGVEEKKHVETPTPVQLDAESFLGPKLVRGEAKPGSTFTMKVLNVLAEKVQEVKLEVLAVEPGPSEKGEVPCTKVKQTDLETKSEMILWIDGDGAVARLKAPRVEILRVLPEVARAQPQEPATFSITVHQTPPIERIFSADRVLVDVHLRGDPDRALPAYPESAFSRVVGVEGSDEKGYVVHVEMKAHDAPEAKAVIPVADPAFRKDLESTVLLCIGEPDVLSTAKKVVGEEKDARKAAQKLSDYVFSSLRKEAPSVGDLSAAELLRERKGYCSDHCVLFTALCRAVGIPARRCSGFVCVGSLWGAHAWSEIWTGEWIGVDPTTNDVGTAARYLFFGYSDDPASHPGVVSANSAERMRFEVTHLDEGADHLDLSDPAAWTFIDAEKKVASHRLAGIELRDWPADWTVDLGDDAKAFVQGPGFGASIVVYADQGYRGLRFLRGAVAGRESRFSGAPSVLMKGTNRRAVAVSSRRRVVKIELSLVRDDDADPRPNPDLDSILATLEKVMAKTFTPKP